MIFKQMYKKGVENMTVILCVDDRGGLCFAGRRQSQDRYVRKDILALCQTKRLFMDHYSKGQFTEPEGALIEVADDFLDVLGEEDVCFFGTTDSTALSGAGFPTDCLPLESALSIHSLHQASTRWVDSDTGRRILWIFP